LKSREVNMRNVFKSFESIGVNTRLGVIISQTTKGYKIETFSAYSDQKEYIYYIRFNSRYPEGMKWGEVVNSMGTTEYQCLMEDIDSGNITPYRIIEK